MFFKTSYQRLFLKVEIPDSRDPDDPYTNWGRTGFVLLPISNFGISKRSMLILSKGILGVSVIIKCELTLRIFR